MQIVPPRHSTNGPGFDEFSRRYQTLLHAAEIAYRRGLPDLLQELAKRLSEAFDFNFLNYALHYPSTNVMRLYVLDQELGVSEHPIDLSIENSPAGWAWSRESPLVIADLETETKFPMALDLYRAQGLRSLVALPMATAHVHLGTLCFGSARPAHFDSETVAFLERITGLVGLAIENSLARSAGGLNHKLGQTKRGRRSPHRPLFSGLQVFLCTPQIEEVRQQPRAQTIPSTASSAPGSQESLSASYRPSATGMSS
jgi:GAF domain-containing protein